MENDDGQHQEAQLQKRAVIGGIALFVLGVALTLGRLDLVEVDRWWRWWPLLLIAVGIWVASRQPRPKALREGSWVIFTGLWLLLSFQEWLGFSFRDSWPLWIVFAGAIDLVLPEPGKDRFVGLSALLVGLWLLATVRHWWGLDLATAWPVALILAGIGIVLRAVILFAMRRPE